ncbi:glutathione-dependent formaldehyde dehydrogenase [Paecilomyces variotii No. 5]|uniref:Glutathione-dependent formaldehyde dehydrogenase n=1 Tax=Byssochlamys spectabilis (strain No. 5 / NBRC 109023) TaxID=1356009 RepID=V5G6K2_BYSSN|nr:glutathione-dependent formaldehyde dehydrogenase [Paecilomyces variotii No. 5]
MASAPPTITTDISNYADTGHGDPHQSMKALTYQSNNRVKLVETARPTIVDAGDVIVKVTGSTICGSDLHLFHGAIPELKKGDILGHEFCGVVEKVGPQVKKRKVGERVVASFQIACGECFYCKEKLSSICERTNGSSSEDALYGRRTAGMFGYSHFTGGFAGGQAEFVRVPLGDVNLLPLPDDVPDEKGLYLSDVLCTSWNAVVDTGVKKGDSVAIWGAGPVGQMAAEFALVNGASKVVMIDGGEGRWRLDFLKKKIPHLETVDYTRLPKGETVVSTLKRMCNGGRGPDIAIECAAGEYSKGLGHQLQRALGMENDTSELLNEMITACNHFNIGSLMETGIHLNGNGQAPVHKYWEELLTLIQQDKIRPMDMVTHRFKLEDMEKVYDMFNHRAAGMQKIFVETQYSAPPAPGAPTLTAL